MLSVTVSLIYLIPDQKEVKNFIFMDYLLPISSYRIGARIVREGMCCLNRRGGGGDGLIIVD